MPGQRKLRSRPLLHIRKTFYWLRFPNNEKGCVSSECGVQKLKVPLASERRITSERKLEKFIPNERC
jgi:hypothetical protein